jgi:uncharacterized protein YndB with AHSA1/START domain
MSAHQTIAPAPVRKTLTIKASPARAFEVFTGGIDRWWPRSHHTGEGELKKVIVEPREGGRWYEETTVGTESEWGKVLAWEPPQGAERGRLMLAWQLGADFKYDPDLITEVEVLFTDIGEGRTRVDFEHRNLERMGAKAAEARAAVDSPGGWGAILAAFGEAAET